MKSRGIWLGFDSAKEKHAEAIETLRERVAELEKQLQASEDEIERLDKVQAREWE